MSVYAIEAKDAGIVKIGMTGDVMKRFEEVARGIRPLSARLFHYAETKDDRKVEKIAHTLLSRIRHEGEWFNADGRLAALSISTAIGIHEQAPSGATYRTRARYARLYDVDDETGISILRARNEIGISREAMSEVLGRMASSNNMLKRWEKGISPAPMAVKLFIKDLLLGWRPSGQFFPCDIIEIGRKLELSR